MNNETRKLIEVMHSLGFKHGSEIGVHPNVHYQVLVGNLSVNHSSQKCFIVDTACDNFNSNITLPIDELFKRLLHLTGSDPHMYNTRTIQSFIVYQSYRPLTEGAAYTEKELSLRYPLVFPVTVSWDGEKKYVSLTRRPFPAFTYGDVGTTCLSSLVHPLVRYEPIPTYKGCGALLVIRTHSAKPIEDSYVLIKLSDKDLRRGIARLNNTIACTMPLLIGQEVATLPLFEETKEWVPSIKLEGTDYPFRKVKPSSNMVYQATF